MRPSHAIAIIPARLGSTRFPGKVLADATGSPMIRHVYDAARAAGLVSRVVVATDDRRVIDAVRAFGGEAVLTSPDHPNGSSRLAEACDALAIGDDHIVVNVQGDEPELDPALIDAAVATLRAAPAGVQASTIAAPFAPGEDPADPNIVKVVRRGDGTALYFSRAPIPFHRDAGAPFTGAQPLRHVGLYAYRRPFLRRYATLAPTPLEQAEKLEQLRILEHGFAIAVAALDRPVGGGGIDTPAQYEAFVERWRAVHGGAASKRR